MPTEIHEMVEYLLPVQVDRLVLPLVAALNGWPDVTTLSSCQGNLWSEIDTRAWVTFLAGGDTVHALLDQLWSSFHVVSNWELRVSGRGDVELLVEQEHIEAMAEAIHYAAPAPGGGTQEEHDADR